MNSIMSIRRTITCSAIAALFGVVSCATPPDPGLVVSYELAVADSNRLRIVNPVDTTSPETIITGYQELGGVVYRPDGARLALLDCHTSRILELDPLDSYKEVRVAISGDSCPWDLTYSPDGRSLAATVPTRRGDPVGAMFAKLEIVSDEQAIVLGYDEFGSRKLPALAYRPDGLQLVVATHDAIKILDVGRDYEIVRSVPTGEIGVRSLIFTRDGSRLLAGAALGLVVFDANQGYRLLHTHDGGQVRSVAVDPTGKWIAVLRDKATTLHRSTDVGEVATTLSGAAVHAAFSRDGALLAITDRVTPQITIFDVAAATSIGSVTVSYAQVQGAFRPGGEIRTPVVFVHGRGGDLKATWFDDNPYSMVAGLAANPQLPLDAFFVALPQGRSIAQDAKDLQAMIEGGEDTRGGNWAGILRMPDYQGAGTLGKIALVGYSKGGMTSRYYVRNLMPEDVDPTVSELVLLATPNHGLGWGWCGTAVANPEHGLRQLCGGKEGVDQDCDAQNCDPESYPDSEKTGEDGVKENTDFEFLEQLIGQPLDKVCNKTESDDETPRGSELTYFNLYASRGLLGETDPVTGSEFDGADCLGRRVARLLSSQATNQPLDVPFNLGKAHERFPHQWKVICLTLRAASEHTAPTWITEQTTCGELRKP